MNLLDILVESNRNLHCYGRASSGKTSFFLYVSHEYCKEGHKVVYIDTKKDLDPDQAYKISPNLYLGHTETNFTNVNKIISETNASLCIVDDLTSFYISNHHFEDLICKANSKNCRLVLINQIREDISNQRPVAFFDNKISKSISNNISFSRMESVKDGNIYRIHNDSYLNSIEVLIHNNGVLDELFTMRRYILEMNSKGLMNVNNMMDKDEIRKLYNEKRNEILKYAIDLYSPINPISVWI